MDIRKHITSLKAKYKTLAKQLALIRDQLDDASEIESGDKPSFEQARLIKSQPYSFGVHFERKKVLRKVKSPGAVCRSVRRFTSKKEAIHHGKRFTKIHKHKGFTVIKVNKRANAWVNWLTGKTNPVLNG